MLEAATGDGLDINYKSLVELAVAASQHSWAIATFPEINADCEYFFCTPTFWTLAQQ